MVKNEEFYARAQEAINYYKEQGQYIHKEIVEDLVKEVSNNKDEFPDMWSILKLHKRAKVKEVLDKLKIGYRITHGLGMYFVTNFFLK